MEVNLNSKSNHFRLTKWLLKNTPMELISNKLFIAAAYCVVAEKYCSVFGLQRRLRIDFLKSCEIVEFLLHLGIISKTGLITYAVAISEISVMEEMLDKYYGL